MRDLIEPGQRGRRLRLLLGLAIAVLVAGVMVVDFAITKRSVPELPRLECGPASPPDCQAQVREQLDLRGRVGTELEEALGDRFWLYSLALIGAAATLVIVSLVMTPRTGWREVFTDLGVAGVGWFLVAVVLTFTLAAGDESLDPRGYPLFAPAGAMIAVAAVGSCLTYFSWQRTETIGTQAAEESVPLGSSESVDRAGTRVGSSPLPSRLGLGLTALVVALSVVATEQSSCGDQVPGWVETLLNQTPILALAAVAFGLAALFQRHWAAALICITVGPTFAFFALLFAACLE